MFMTSSKKTYIIIPVHNRKEITLSCLENLRITKALENYSVIVVDDGSTDGTYEDVKREYPSVLIVKGSGDLWWTGAIKLGMEYASHFHAEYIFWLNDDCHLKKNTLSVLIRFMQNYPNTITAPRCLAEVSGSPVKNGCLKRTRKSAAPGEITFVDSLSGYCVGIPRSVYEVIGFPDETRFPHYSGDDTYTLKATRNNYKVCILGNAEVLLKNFEDTEHSFSSYLDCRFSSFPKMKEVFLAKKSRYYLHSQFYYHLEKYTLILGLFLFVVKVILWSIEYFWLFLKNFSTQ
jgi:GT2 family glycosyltransferase